MPKPEFRELVEQCRFTHTRLQYLAARSIDISLVVRNWLFGWYIVEFEGGGADRAELYGKRLIDQLAAELKANGLKGTSPTNLRKCREFYLAWCQSPKIRQALSVESDGSMGMQQTPSVKSFQNLMGTPHFAQKLAVEIAQNFQLGWSHYVALLSLSDTGERRFYEIEAVTASWSVRELKRQIDSALYERLALSRDKAEVHALGEQGLVLAKAADVIKNPFVLEFLELQEQPTYSEAALETAIIDKLEDFLLELGKGFLFEARQKRITFDNDHFYVDLVFYNRLLRCYVLVDLKIGKLRHQDLGQMQMYVNHFDRNVKQNDEAPTIGILLCHRKNDALVELTLPKNSNIYASKYQLYLPSKSELRQKLMDWSQEVKG